MLARLAAALERGQIQAIVGGQPGPGGGGGGTVVIDENCSVSVLSVLFLAQSPSSSEGHIWVAAPTGVAEKLSIQAPQQREPKWYGC